MSAIDVSNKIQDCLCFMEQKKKSSWSHAFVFLKMKML